tara:strand:- start:2684 stop:3121 length:438 start_codon:yes stop_codon:yes gene_type:complete
MLGAQQPLHPAVEQKGCQESLRNLFRQHLRPVLRECRGVSDRIVDAKLDEPAKQKIEVQPLHQLPLGTDRIKQLQHYCPQQPLRRNRRAAAFLMQRCKPGIERQKRRVHQIADRPKRMTRRNAILRIGIGSRRYRSSMPRIAPIQ